ncbi:hypothetical protein [Cetobacterium sp.]|uniref:hypothetical protein n=1 Tax=Cetobacterium sp. TaxID=2071632 RepID=UPI003EE6E713
MSKINLRRGQAMSLQWVAYFLEKVKLDIEKNNGNLTKEILGNATAVNGKVDYDSLKIGCSYGLNFILPFALELGLKSLLEKEGIPYRRIHKLDELFDLLPNEVRLRINYKVSQNKINIRMFLIKFSNNFVNARYLDNPVDLEYDSHNMQLILCSVLDEIDKEN